MCGNCGYELTVVECPACYGIVEIYCDNCHRDYMHEVPEVNCCHCGDEGDEV